MRLRANYYTKKSPLYLKYVFKLILTTEYLKCDDVSNKTRQGYAKVP